MLLLFYYRKLSETEKIADFRIGLPLLVPRREGRMPISCVYLSHYRARVEGFAPVLNTWGKG